MISIKNSQFIKTYPLRGIPDYPMYKINDYGEVITLFKRVSNGYRKGTKTVKCNAPQYLLEPHLNTDKYYDICIKDANNKKIIRLVHQLVLEANGYIKPFEDAEVRHLDGNRLNNHISNLRWGTSKENGEDLAKHGTLKGHLNPFSKLKPTDILFIRNSGLSTSDLMAKFKATRSCICNARNGRTYQNVN